MHVWEIVSFDQSDMLCLGIVRSKIVYGELLILVQRFRLYPMDSGTLFLQVSNIGYGSSWEAQ